MQLRSNRYVLSKNWLLRLTWLTLVLFGLESVFVASLSRGATIAPTPRLSWTEEDGTELPVDWRTSTAWIWSRNRFSLQIWIEIPKDLLQASRADISRHDDLQIESSGPFRLRPGHLFLVAKMRSPIRFIQLKSDLHDTHVRALRIELPYTKTTWMRENSCPAPSPYLIERSRQAKGPFFVAIRCPAETQTLKTSNESIAIQIQVSDDGLLTIDPKGETSLHGADKLIVRPAVVSVRSQQLLADLTIKDQQGLRVAEFELRRQQDPPASRPIFLSDDHFLMTVLGLSAMALSANYQSSESPSWGGVDPALTLDWIWMKAKADPLLIIESQLPLAAFSNPFGSTVTHFGWLRLLRASPQESTKRPNRELWGLQATYLKAPDTETGSTVWVSPTLGFQTETGDHSTWSVLISPFAVGAGSDGWARLQVSVRRESEIVRRESVGLALFAEGVVLRSFTAGAAGWSASGLNFGLRGVFQ